MNMTARYLGIVTSVSICLAVVVAFTQIITVPEAKKGTFRAEQMANKRVK